jgi:hypothetical protein
VRAAESPGDSARVLLDALEGVLPELSDYSTDEALRDEWLAGASPGLVEMQRLMYLAILLNVIGPPEKLERVVGDLRSLVSGSVHQRLVETRLARAGVRLP